jgi:hypothetical protein
MTSLGNDALHVILASSYAIVHAKLLPSLTSRTASARSFSIPNPSELGLVQWTLL